MSNVKRYGFPWLECDATDEAYMQENGMTELKDGGFVLWADYARLQAENERLTTTMEKVITTSDVIDERNQLLIAENVRLCKAGDAMASSVNRFLTEHISDCDWIRDGLANWLAAKEVQS